MHKNVKDTKENEKFNYHLDKEYLYVQMKINYNISKNLFHNKTQTCET